MTLEEAIQSLNLSVDMIPSGSSNRPGTRLHPTHITVHNTDNSSAGADAQAHARYLKGPDARARKVSWHYTADDSAVIQHLPDNEVGWHAGSGNSKSVAVEICQNSGIDQAAANDRAALLVAVLMKRHGIKLTAVVPHKFWTGKHCPGLLLNGSGGFQAFVASVSERVNQIEDGRLERMISFDGPSASLGVVTPDHELEGRVRILEELLGRAVADAEILRRQIAASQNEQYEAP